VPEPVLSPLYADTDFNGPLSDARAARIIASLGSITGHRIVDLGCGWAELLLRTVATDAAATGFGIDRDRVAIEHGRANAAARGLADRVVLEVGDAAGWAADEPVDVVFNIGASHVFGGSELEHTGRALTSAHALLRPGGRLVFGECFWAREPTESELSVMPIPLDQLRSLPDLVDFAQAHGFRLLALSRASIDEWDDFESRHGLAYERWLLANPTSPDAEDLRTRADEHRTRWLRGWREPLGFAYLTLVRAD